MPNLFPIIVGSLAAAAGLGSPATAQFQIDAKIPAYERASGVSGSIKSVGSDTMNNLMSLWAEGFKKAYPNVEVEIEGKGSNTAPPALIDGTGTFGPMSRELKAKEQDDFEKAYGYKATQLPAAIDMLAVYVHKDNPIAATGLTLRQIDAIFSKTRRGGSSSDIRTWGELGLTGDWANKPISMFGRNSASGTYGYFKDHALFGGDFKDGVKQQPGSSSVVQGVASDKYAIGYSGMGYTTADVRAVPLGETLDAVFPPTLEAVADYPLSRFLYITLNFKPGGNLEALRREFLRYVLSRDGQLVVAKEGCLPLPFEVCQQSLAEVGIPLEPAVSLEPAPPRKGTDGD